MKLLLKVASLIFGFGIPIGIFIHYFQGEPKEVIEQSFGFVPAILVGIIGLVAIRMVFTIVQASITQDKTGTTAITFYLIVLLVLFLSAWSLLTHILNTAINNYEQFVTTYTLYINVVKASSASIAIGLALNGIEHYLRFKARNSA